MEIHTHTRSIDLVGVESAHSAIEVKDSQMKPETPNASHTTRYFWREMLIETLSSKTSQPLATLLFAVGRFAAKKWLAPLAKRSTCSKSRLLHSLEFLKKSFC